MLLNEKLNKLKKEKEELLKEGSVQSNDGNQQSRVSKSGLLKIKIPKTNKDKDTQAQQENKQKKIQALQSKTDKKIIDLSQLSIRNQNFIQQVSSKNQLKQFHKSQKNVNSNIKNEL